MRAGGSLVEGIQGYRQGKYEANVAGFNAGVARQNASQTRMEGALAEEAKRREVRQSLGRSAASMAQAGIGAPASGSAGTALRQAATEGELDALNIRYGAETRARGFETEALNYDMERMAAKRRAKGAVVSGIFGAGSEMLSGRANSKVAKARA